MRALIDIDLGHEAVPDEPPVSKFRHLQERHELGKRIFERVAEHLQASATRR